MKKREKILAEDVFEMYKELSPFERIEFGEIVDDYAMGLEESCEDKLLITTPKVKEIFENYRAMSSNEKAEFDYMISNVES